MNTQEFKRKLAAIFSADVAGYSRLMGENEAATVKTLEAYKQVMFALIKQHRGRVVDDPGDNLLAEFASVVDAVQCGVAVQNELKARNADLPENRRMQFRIGINLGDVIEEEDRIYGDGVNIAARLESCADPGGICVSKTAFDHIETKLPLGYEYLGEKEVKNIAKPVGAYRVLMEPRVTVAGTKEKKTPVSVWRRRGVLAGALAALIVIIVAVVWNSYFRPPQIEPASVEKMAHPIPDKPSIAVLPFDNMSDDPDQEYFSDGMTDDIITDLSKISGLIIISRNSTFALKGKKINIQDIAKELGVRYVLEGSVRRADDMIRINAQLIDARNDHHLWAERFDGKNNNIFELQDKITGKIVSALAVKLSDPEQQTIAEKGTDNIFAYEAYLNGMKFMRQFTPEDYVKAIESFKKAIELDKNYSDAYANLAYTYLSALYGGEIFWKKIGIDFSSSRVVARHYVESAMKRPTSRSYQVLALMELYKRHFSSAIDYAQRAVAISPNDADALETLGLVMVRTDNPEAGMKYYKRSIMLDPLHKSTGGIGTAYFSMGNYEQAVKYLEKALKDYPETYGIRGFLASAYAHIGNEINARKAFKDWHT